DVRRSASVVAGRGVWTAFDRRRLTHMVIKRMSLPRRTFLRGAGAALALPLLNAMVPALTAMSKTAAAPAPRLGFVYVPNGVQLVNFLPKVEGPAFDVTPILSPLAAFRDRLVVVSGLSNAQADALDQGSGPHTRGQSVWLNGVRTKRTDGPDIQQGKT